MAGLSRSGTSGEVRDLAVRKYVEPSRRLRMGQFSIPVRALLNDLKSEGFPAGNTPQICSAIQSKKFLAENHLHIERVEGPPSRQSTTVVVHYRFQEQKAAAGGVSSEETREVQARRLASEAAGLLQPVLDQFADGDALLRWIRSEDVA